MADAELVFEPLWHEQVFRQEQMKRLMAATVARLVELAVSEAPATKPRNWNKIRRNITGDVSLSPSGWIGAVIVEKNDDVRHAMLQNEGWTDKKHRRHPGRKYLKKALEKGRIA
ncbi:hypothetical protein [Streptomyces decoyicus]